MVKQLLFKILQKKLLGDIKEVFRISKIELSIKRENNIKDCFRDQNVHFNHPNNVEDLNYLLDMCKRDKADYIENNLGEKMVLDKLINKLNGVKEAYVSGIADKSHEFAIFFDCFS